MLVGHVYIMIFIAQSITQQERNNSKKLSLQLFHDPLGHVDALLSLLSVYIYSIH